jgi:hypothetical protein
MATQLAETISAPLSAPLARRPAEWPRSVIAPVNYHDAAGPRPVAYMYDPPPGTPLRTGSTLERRVAIEDLRSALEPVSLDVQGFALVPHDTAVANFYDEAEIRQRYLAEAEQLVRDVTGAGRVIAFDHNVRNGAKAQAGEAGVREPVRRVHNDFTARSGHTRARLELEARGLAPAEIDRLLAQRFALINVWRPIRGPVLDTPLALIDARTIAPRDLVLQDLIYRDRIGETYAVTYNPAHRWFYAPAMSRDEALLIKVFDSDTGVARFSAHSAFDDPTAPAGGRPRESIEVRTLALFAPPA